MTVFNPGAADSSLRNAAEKWFRENTRGLIADIPKSESSLFSSFEEAAQQTLYHGSKWAVEKIAEVGKGIFSSRLPKFINEETTRFITKSCVVSGDKFTEPNFTAAELIGPLFLTVGAGMISLHYAKEALKRGRMLVCGSERIVNVADPHFETSTDKKVDVLYVRFLPYTTSKLWASMATAPVISLVSGFVAYETGKAMVARLMEADGNLYSIAMLVGGAYLTVKGISYLLNKESAPQTEIQDIHPVSLESRNCEAGQAKVDTPYETGNETGQVESLDEEPVEDEEIQEEYLGEEPVEDEEIQEEYLREEPSGEELVENEILEDSLESGTEREIPEEVQGEELAKLFDEQTNTPQDVQKELQEDDLEAMEEGSRLPSLTGGYKKLPSLTGFYANPSETKPMQGEIAG